MTTTPARKYKALILGDLWEIDHIFDLDLFNERFPVETVHVDNPEEFRDAVQDPAIDIILIDVNPYGLAVLDAVRETPPMRPVLMVADPDNADVIIEAKKTGLQRYVIRLEDDQMNIDLLRHEIESTFEDIVQPPKMTHTTVEDLFRYAQYHNVRQPFFIIDLQRRLLYTNGAGVHFVERLHDHKLDLGDKPEQFFLDESPEAFIANLERAFAGEDIEVMQAFEALPVEERHLQVLYQPVRRDGGDIIAVSIAVKDVGERRKVEERLKAHAEALWKYFDIVPLPLKVVDEDRIIQHVNSAFADLLEYDHPDQLEGHSAEEFVHPDDQEEVFAALERLFSGEQSYFQAEHRYCNHQGHVVWVNHIGFVLDSRDDASMHILMIAVDITRQQEAEQRAEQSVRMEAIGELAGGVAHDFNNVLAIVTAFGHVLETELSERNEGDLITYVDKIQRAVDSGASLTQQLLSFSRNNGFEHELIDLNRRIREISELLERTLGKDIDMHLDLDSELPPIEVGKGQIDQVTMNLAVNARDAMADGGTLSIRTYQTTVTPQQFPPHPNLEPDQWVTLVISDTGVGMARETQKRIFEPFFTTKQPGEGTGMGLATVYRIVEAAGGTIYVDSAPDKGTTFTLYFPASQSQPDQRPPEQAPETQESREDASEPAAACVLLVEDEDDIREPYRIFLEHDGYRVIDAADIEQAHAAIEQADVTIDVLLADVILPDGSGVDLAKLLIDQFDDLEIIFMSGYAPDLIYRDQEELAGRWSFLPKPVSRKKLLSAVSEALGRGSP